MADELLTFTLTREAFPHFKRLLETTKFFVEGDEIQLFVDEPTPGVMRITSALTLAQGKR